MWYIQPHAVPSLAAPPAAKPNPSPCLLPSQHPSPTVPTSAREVADLPGMGTAPTVRCEHTVWNNRYLLHCSAQPWSFTAASFSVSHISLFWWLCLPSACKQMTECNLHCIAILSPVQCSMTPTLSLSQLQTIGLSQPGEKAAHVVLLPASSHTAVFLVLLPGSLSSHSPGPEHCLQVGVWHCNQSSAVLRCTGSWQLPFSVLAHRSADPSLPPPSCQCIPGLHSFPSQAAPLNAPIPWDEFWVHFSWAQGMLSVIFPLRVLSISQQTSLHAVTKVLLLQVIQPSLPFGTYTVQESQLSRSLFSTQTQTSHSAELPSTDGNKAEGQQVYTAPRGFSLSFGNINFWEE